MAAGLTTFDTGRYRDQSVTRGKLNTSLAGSAVLTKLLAGAAVTLGSTGVDAGTGDVTITPAGRNFILNGNFTINQRNYASGGTLAASTGYGHDRWGATNAGSATYTFTQPSQGDCTITLTSGVLAQVIEGQNLPPGTYTLSWTGTANGRVVQAASSINTFSNTSPITVTITTQGDTRIAFSGTNVTLGLVQFEAGSVPTPFDRRLPYAQQLALCQRYYFQNTGTAANALSASGYAGLASNILTETLPLPVTMRVVPTMALIGTYVYSNGSSASVVSGSVSTFVFSFKSAAAGACSAANPASGGYSASAEYAL